MVNCQNQNEFSLFVFKDETENERNDKFTFLSSFNRDEMKTLNNSSENTLSNEFQNESFSHLTSEISEKPNQIIISSICSCENDEIDNNITRNLTSEEDYALSFSLFDEKNIISRSCPQNNDQNQNISSTFDEQTEFLVFCLPNTSIFENNSSKNFCFLIVCSFDMTK